MQMKKIYNPEVEEISEADLEAASDFYDRLMTKKELCFGHFGHGIGVWIKGTNDFVAHIDPDRRIKWREQLTNEEAKLVEDYAKTADPEISATQNEKVFKERP